MDVQQILPRVPKKVQFRILIIGKANAGKTSILQRLCDTTESPVIYSFNSSGDRSRRVQFDPSAERGEHNIEDEAIFSCHDGYIFHDSCGFEGGDEMELEIVQEFVRRKSQERRLRDRLHAIWYCIPMDNPRPELELKHFEHICPDKNVPVIAVFTKYEQFKREVMMKLEDSHGLGGGEVGQALLDARIEETFKKCYLAHLRESVPFVRLEKMHKPGQGSGCTPLIEKTADALSGSVVALMLLAVQKNNLELNVRQAVKWYVTFVCITGRKWEVHCSVIGPIPHSKEGMRVQKEH